jgi:hypothetical protein
MSLENQSIFQVLKEVISPLECLVIDVNRKIKRPDVVEVLRYLFAVHQFGLATCCNICCICR